MRRKRLRAAVLVVVVLALAVVAYETAKSVALQKVDEAARKIREEVLPEVAQQLKNFKRVKVENGRTVWEVTADDAQLMTGDAEAVVRGPKVTIYFKDDDRRATITGAEGKLHLSGKEVKKVELSGDVTVQLDDVVLTTAAAIYDHEADKITAPGAVVLKGRTLDVHGTGMEVNVAPQVVRLLADVRTVLRSDGSPS